MAAPDPFSDPEPASPERSEGSEGSERSGRSGRSGPPAREARGRRDEPEDREDSSREPTSSLALRLLRVGGALFEVHVATARAEARRDQARILRGLILVLIGASLLGAVTLVVQVAGIWLLTQRGLSLGQAALAVAGADVVLAVILLVLGGRALQKPLLPSTRALLKRTLSSLAS